jgi:hypothetical protein
MTRPEGAPPVEETGFLLLPQFPIYALGIANRGAGRGEERGAAS